MNKFTALLEDVLAENASPDLRAALLAETLRHARRRRQRRHAIRACAVLSVLGAFIWWNLLVRAPATNMPTANYESIQTRPLPTSAVIATKPLSAEFFMVSVPTVTRVSTKATRADFRLIGDDELLAIAPQPAVLVRAGPGAQQLIFGALEEQSRVPLY